MTFQSTCAASLLLAFATCVGATDQDQPELPNIVLFLVDDMGIMDTSVPFLTNAEGRPERFPLNDHYRTPNMERLAAQGIRFNNFYAMSVCSPTRISILTGQNAARHRTTNWIHPDRNNRNGRGPLKWSWKGLNSNSVTLPRLLQSAGYRTIHVGKAHFGPRGSEGGDPLNLGFHVNVAGSSIGHPGSYYGRDDYGHATKTITHAVPGLEKYHGSETFLTEALTLEAKSKLSEAIDARQPFFLYLSHYAVHSPFHSDPRFADAYKDSGQPKSAQAFATMIEGMDRSLGNILDYLEQANVAENTLVIFLGDNGSDAPLGDTHGVASAAPLRGKKATQYEGGMRVPFIAAWAKRSSEHPWQEQLQIPPGGIQEQLASVEDLLPTITSLVGTDLPSDHITDGQSLQRLLTGEPDPAHDDSFLMHFPHDHRSDYFTSLRDGDWKVVYHFFPTDLTNGSHYELFNLAQDPSESTNLASHEPATLKRMMTTLVEQLASHDALFPITETVEEPVLPVIPK